MKTKVFFKVATLCLVAFVAAFSFQSCKEAKAVPQADLEGFWVLKSLNGKDASTLFEGALPTLGFNFADSTISGTGGCNAYNGKFTYEKGVFNAPNVAITTMLCTEKNEEPEFVKALSNLNNELSVVNGVLTFTCEGKPSLVFEKTTAPKEAAKMEPDSKTMAGTWALKTIDGMDAKTKFAGEVPTLNFDFTSNKVSGTDGCNRINGTFTLNKYDLVLSQLVSTRMACENMEAVQLFTNAISDSSIVSVPNKDILQLAKKGQILLEFEKVATDSIK